MGHECGLTTILFRYWDLPIAPVRVKFHVYIRRAQDIYVVFHTCNWAGIGCCDLVKSTFINAELQCTVFLRFYYDRRSQLTLECFNDFSCQHLVNMFVDELALLWTCSVWELPYWTRTRFEIYPVRRTLDCIKVTGPHVFVFL